MRFVPVMLFVIMFLLAFLVQLMAGCAPTCRTQVFDNPQVDAPRHPPANSVWINIEHQCRWPL